MDDDGGSVEPTSALTVPHQIEEKVGEILGRAGGKPPSPRQISEVTSEIVNFLMEEQYSGPLPHPKHFEEFERIQPGSADRILKMAEVEQQHRHALESRVADANIDEMKSERRYSFVGLYSGLSFAVLVIVAGVVCAFIEAKEIGLGFVSVGFIGVVAQFINGRKKRDPGSNPPVSPADVDEPDRVRRRAAVKGARQARKRRTNS